MKFVVPFLLLFATTLHAQSFQVGSTEEQVLQALQLQGKIDLNYSFTTKPYYQNRSVDLDSLNKMLGVSGDDALTNKHLWKKKYGQFTLLPITWKQQFNSHHPYGWNDGAMIPAKGYQTLTTLGFYTRLGPLSLQVLPEFLHAYNPDFESNGMYGAPTGGQYKKILAGQSSLRLNVAGVSLGVSSENIYWGPGSNSALIMSNNAPGFYHLTFNSIRPIKTWLGSFEWQLIVGKLEQDTGFLAQVTELKPNNISYPQSRDWRYINGLTLSFQPKIMPGVFFGFSRVFQVYSAELNRTPIIFFNDYLPVFGTLFKSKINITDNSKNNDQVVSVFTRWIFPKSHASFYVEYGWNDHSYDIRDFVMAPTHSAAYLVGFKKQVSLKKNRFLLIESEITHMQESPDGIVRLAGNWYEHSRITTGYTHHNQIMGAGSGFGNNVQTITVSRFSGWNKIGFQLERVQNNPVMSSVKWSDYALGLFGQCKRKHFVFTANTKFIQSENYAWMDKENRFNFNGELGIQYRF